MVAAWSQCPRTYTCCNMTLAVHVRQLVLSVLSEVLLTAEELDGSQQLPLLLGQLQLVIQLTKDFMLKIITTNLWQTLTSIRTPR